MNKLIFLPVRYRRLLLIIIAIMYSCILRPTFADSVDEYTAKSILALNLARFSEWPPEVFKDNQASVNLCLLGDDATFKVFTMIDKKPVGNKSLLLRNINNNKQLDDCHLLYVSADTNLNAGLIEGSNKRHILTIGETEDFLANGGAVYLEMVDSKITLHVNVSATEKAGIRISSRVLKLATIYNP